MRRIALATMTVAVLLLVVTLASRNTESASSSSNPAAGESAPGESAPAALPTTAPTPNPFAVTTADESFTITRLSSRTPNTARAEGTIAVDEIIVPVTVDGQPLDDIMLTSNGAGQFTIDITGLTPGPQQICLADACQRVLVADPAVEDRATIEARIDQAIGLAQSRIDIDLDVALPGWTIQIGGQNTSAGGSTTAASRTITINANSGRSLEDYEITVLHEFGHAVDHQWLTDLERNQFRAARGHASDLVWGPVDEFAVGDDRWNNSAEDFAEVFVAWALDNNYVIQTAVVGPQPSDDDLLDFCALLATASPITCDS